MLDLARYGFVICSRGEQYSRDKSGTNKHNMLGAKGDGLWIGKAGVRIDRRKRPPNDVHLKAKKTGHSLPFYTVFNGVERLGPLGEDGLHEW